MIVLILVFLCVGIVALGFFYVVLLWSFFAGAPFIPTGGGDIVRIFEQITIKPGAVFYELGSGDGRIVRAAAKVGARAIGIEQSLILVLWARFIAHLQCSARLQSRLSHYGGGQRDAHAAHYILPRYIRANCLAIDLSDADLVFCYLMPPLMGRLKEKFERELKPGARVISYAFKIPGWTVEQRLSLRRRNLPAYVYLVK